MSEPARPRRALRVTLLLNDAAAAKAYAPLIEALAGRGHRLHLAILDRAMADPERRLSKFAAAHPLGSIGHALSRADRWTWTASALRAAMAAIGAGQSPAQNPALEALEDLGLLARGAELPRALAALARAHAALPPSPQIRRLIEHLDVDVLVLTDLEKAYGAQADYLLACRRLGAPALFLEGAASKTGRAIAALYEPDALLTAPADMPPVEAIEAAAAVGWRPRRPSPWSSAVMGVLRAKVVSAMSGRRRVHGEGILPAVLSVSALAVPKSRPLLREALSERLGRDELRRLAAIDAAIAQAIEGSGPVVFGPWTGPADQELLFWIPFIIRLRKACQIDKERMVAVGVGQKRLWYASAGAYLDLGELYGSGAAPGARHDPLFALDCARRAAAQVGPGRFGMVSPEVMAQLYEPFLAGRAGPAFMDAHARYQPIPLKPGRVERAISGRAKDYVMAQFHGGPSFPDTPDNRALAEAVVRRLAESREVVLLTDPQWADGRAQSLVEGLSGLRIARIDPKLKGDLSAQSLLVAGSGGFVGAPGAGALLAAQLGRPSLCLTAQADAGQTLQLDWARQAFAPFGGSLTVLPVQAIEDVGRLFEALASAPAAPGRERLASVG